MPDSISKERRDALRIAVKAYPEHEDLAKLIGLVDFLEVRQNDLRTSMLVLLCRYSSHWKECPAVEDFLVDERCTCGLSGLVREHGITQEHEQEMVRRMIAMTMGSTAMGPAVKLSKFYETGEREALAGYGVPGIRDPENPCDLFDIGDPDETANCETDGHHFCNVCRHRTTEGLERKKR